MKTYKLIFYVPESHVELVKEAVFATGAGQQGNYDQCCWQTLGVGQFRPLPGSQPFIGNDHILEQVAEYRVELLCDECHLDAAVAALCLAHPYEEPAFDIVLRHTI